jgi:hypothetical protein
MDVQKGCWNAARTIYVRVMGVQLRMVVTSKIGLNINYSVHIYVYVYMHVCINSVFICFSGRMTIRGENRHDNPESGQK